MAQKCIAFKTFLLGILSLTAGLLSSQNETKKWYFGDKAALDFMTSPPTALFNSAMTTQEGCASIADAAGNLLFYTDGITIWNSSHIIMANGSGLFGNGSSTQSGVIVKLPGSTNLYYVFTLDAVGGANGLRYSIVNTSLAAGSGSVTVKNTLLQTPSSEKLTAVKHCNGTDIWIISHDLNTDNFRVFLLTASGISSTVVNSAVGTVQQNMLGSMKASSNGRKLGLAIYTTNNTFEVYDFDNATGVVSNPVILGSSFYLPYGCDFSPDGKLFYGCNGTAGNSGIIYQWDLCVGSASAIIASQVTVATTPVALSSMQLAPDGKIYVSRYMQNSLGVINNPNVYGTGCNYVDAAISVAPKICRFGLPNFVTSYLKQSSPPYTYTASVASCLNASFTVPPTNTCTATSYSISGYSWNFGDAASTSSNTSTLLNPTHRFTAPGTYTSQLLIHYTCGADTLKQVVTIPGAPNVTVSGSFSICAGDKKTFTASGANTYTWSTGANSTTISLSPTVTTTYSVAATNSNACPTSKIFTVNVTKCTGIDHLTKDEGLLKIYPNPVYQNLIIETMNKVSIMLINQKGETVFESSFDSGTHSIDLNNYSNGIYTLKAISEQEVYIKRILKLE